MEAYWNKLALDRPPTTSWRCSINDFDSNNFLKIIEKVIKDLELQMTLQTEAAILSRLIYRMKSKLRSDKGLKNMEKVNRALLNYLKISLEKEYKYLVDNTEREENVLILPSRQMLQYVLVRTQGFAKLMCRIENVAERAGEFFKSRISLGQAWNMSLVAYAVISRIWLLSRYFTKMCCNWYNRIYEYHEKLKIIGVPWLSENYRFPEDLKTWLSVPWIDEDFKKIPKKEGLSDGIFNLITRHGDAEEDLEFVAEDTRDACVSGLTSIVKSVGTGSMAENSTVSKVISRNKIKPPPVLLDEIGKRISRDAFAGESGEQSTKVQPAKKLKIVKGDDPEDIVEIRSREKTKSTRKISRRESTKKRKVPSTEDIKTREDVMKFLSLESYPGLDKLKWKMIRKNVKKLLIKLNKCEGSSNTKKQNILLTRVIRSIREWIN